MINLLKIYQIKIKYLYLIEEKFSSKNLELLKQKGTYPYEYMDSFERFNEEKLPDKNILIVP